MQGTRLSQREQNVSLQFEGEQGRRRPITQREAEFLHAGTFDELDLGPAGALVIFQEVVQVYCYMEMLDVLVFCNNLEDLNTHGQKSIPQYASLVIAGSKPIRSQKIDVRKHDPVKGLKGPIVTMTCRTCLLAPVSAKRAFGNWVVTRLSAPAKSMSILRYNQVLMTRPVISKEVPRAVAWGARER